MRILMVGTMVPQKFEMKITDLSNAANRYLMNFSEALCKKGHEIELVSYLGISVSDEVRDALMHTGDYAFKTSKIVGGVWKCHRMIYRKLANCDCLISYNVVYGWLFSATLARMKKKKSVLILADFSDKDAYTSIWRKLYAIIQKYFIRKFSIVVGLSENTKTQLRDGQIFLCIEGGISQQVYDYFEGYSKNQNGEEIILMYSGVLEKVTGVDLLLETFSFMNDRRLHLCISGKGSMLNSVKSASEKDKRIEYLGCPAYEKYLDNLKKADILINPRNMNMPENDNNFPSKIMEYLATGKPIISTRFAGWERFKDEIVFCDSTVESMKKRMEQVVEEYNGLKIFQRNREKAKDYLWDKQVQKILDVVQE